jgi:hypothetical protein
MSGYFSVVLAAAIAALGSVGAVKWPRSRMPENIAMR